jgi:hypothetical protein
LFKVKIPYGKPYYSIFVIFYLSGTFSYGKYIQLSTLNHYEERCEGFAPPPPIWNDRCATITPIPLIKKDENTPFGEPALERLLFPSVSTPF